MAKHRLVGSAKPFPSQYAVHKASRVSSYAVMEQLFRPCERLSSEIPVGLKEYELAVDLITFSKEPQLIESYLPLIDFLDNSLVWLSKQVLLVSRSGDCMLNAALDFRSASSSAPHLSMSFRTSSSHRVTRSSAALIFWRKDTAEEEVEDERDSEAICQVVNPFLSLLQDWQCRTVRLQSYGGDKLFHASREPFEALLASASLKELELINVNLQSSQCHALGHVQSDQLKLTFWDVSLNDSASFNAGLAQNLGPTKMEVWTMLDSSGLKLLASFSANTRLKGLVCGGSGALQSENIDLVVSALATNNGLEHLCLSCSISSQAWGILWKAIEGHPALQHADIRNSSNDSETSCIREYNGVIASCLKTNKALQKIDIPARHRDGYTWQRLVLPALEANKYRPRFEAIRRLENHDRRDALIAKALTSVNSKPHLLYLAIHHGSMYVNL